MAGFKLRITLQGMCVFVPQLWNGTQRLWAFLLDLRQRDERIPGMKPHGGVINFLLSDVEGVTSAPSTAQGEWLLDNQDVRIVTGSSQALTIAGFSTPPLIAPAPGEPIDRSHFGHLASFEEAGRARGVNGLGKIKPGLLDDVIPPADQPGILARFLFTEGSARASGLTQYRDQPIVWRFRPPGTRGGGTDHCQYVASGVSIEVDVPGPAIEIRGAQFDGTRRQKLALRPSGSSTVGLHVMNEESDALTGLGVPDLIEPGVERPADRMFALYSRLTDRQIPFEEIPIPVADRREGGGGLALDPTWGSPPCASGRLEAFGTS